MNREIFVNNINQLVRQRNVFLILTLLAISSCLLLAGRLMTMKERVILVPGLAQEVWTEKDGVSSSYLEEVSNMYLPLLLDLDSGSIEWKRDHLMKYVSQSDKRYMEALVKYYSAAKEKYEQFALSTHFAVKKFAVDPRKLIVKVHGQLTSRFGKEGVESVPAVYGLTFEWVSGKLLLAEFVKLPDKDEVARGK